MYTDISYKVKKPELKDKTYCYTYGTTYTNIPDPQNYKHDISRDTNVPESDIEIIAVNRYTFDGRKMSATEYKSKLERVVHVLNDLDGEYSYELYEAHKALALWLKISDEFGVSYADAVSHVRQYSDGKYPTRVTW